MSRENGREKIPRRSKEREERETDAAIRAEVEEAFQLGTIQARRFYLIRFSVLCRVSPAKFYIGDSLTLFRGQNLPCEVSLVEYSVNGGASRAVHAFVLPPAIPLGAGWEVVSTARRTHLLDPEEAAPMR